MGEELGLSGSSGLRIDGQVVIVTGANGGIGAAIVRRLERAGATVVALARSEPMIPVEMAALTLAADLCEVDAPGRIVVETHAAFGQIDGLINCAGIQPVVDFASMTDKEWSEMIDVNLTAAHRMTKAVARSMTNAGRAGSIVHIASIEGTHPAIGHSHYAVAKAGLIMHARAAALELGPAGIRVNSVSPGLIDRPRLADDWPDGVARWNSNAPLGRLGTTDDVADSCLFLLSSMATWVTGIDLVVDGGMSASPSW